jgi:endonuclease IV
LTFKIGFHVSITGGIQNSVLRAKEIGYTAFQIFTRNPRGWSNGALVESEVENYQSKEFLEAEKFPIEVLYKDHSSLIGYLRGIYC